MTSQEPIRWDGPLFRPDPPPPGVYALRVSLGCGAADHPRQIAEARRPRDLDAIEGAWRCTTCGRPDWAVTRIDAQRAERRRRTASPERAER